MFLLKILIFFLVFWLIFRLVFRLLLYYFIKKNFDKFNNGQSQNTSQQPDISIHPKTDDDSAQSAEFEELN